MSSPRFRQTEVRNGALARTDRENILLVEAKAHIGEVCSPPSQASVASRQQIEAALNETASFLNAEPRAPWAKCFYQLTNRIARLYFLRKNDLPAWLILVNFLHDSEIGGPVRQQSGRPPIKWCGMFSELIGATSSRRT